MYENWRVNILSPHTFLLKQRVRDHLVFCIFKSAWTYEVFVFKMNFQQGKSKCSGLVIYFHGLQSSLECHFSVSQPPSAWVLVLRSRPSRQLVLSSEGWALGSGCPARIFTPFVIIIFFTEVGVKAKTRDTANTHP